MLASPRRGLWNIINCGVSATGRKGAASTRQGFSVLISLAVCETLMVLAAATLNFTAL